MISRILIFDDSEDDRKRFKLIFEKKGYEFIFIYHPYITEKDLKLIKNFKPQLIIVDSQFTNDLDGLDIVRKINELIPLTPIIICSIIFDDPKKKAWFFNKYKDLPSIRKIIGKRPFPSIEDLINI